MTQACRHEDRGELQDDKEFRKLTRWTRSSHQRLVPLDEMRQAKLFNLTGHMDACTAGLPSQERWTGVPVTLRKSVMPSQDARGRQGMRNCSRKLEVASMYAVSRRSAGTTGGRAPRATQVIDEAELEKALREIGDPR